MKLEEIRAKSLTEDIDISPYIRKLVEQRKAHPKGIDLFIPEYIIPLLEKFCDSENIPFYWVAENCVSTAGTYTQLYFHEKGR